MGDVWIGDYENVNKSINILSGEIKDYSVQMKINPGGVQRNTPTILRRSLITLTNDIARLHDNLTYGNHRILEKELLRRRNLVEGLTLKKNQLSNEFDKVVNNTSAKIELLGDKISDRKFGRETDQTRDLNNHQIYTQQKEIMKTQDQSLDAISSSLKVQLNIANQMSSELEVHNRLLEDVEIGTEAVTHRIKVANSRIETLKQNAGSTCMIVIIIFLILFIIALVATDSGCKIYNSPTHCP
ncbi:putative syntaxin 8 [Tieghemostelium lacteum]|uniref:Putative syntaxin 8 n=1 Tax=Tieghemostelium lacteum TaxID=361077 RepID=A0A151Z9P1_TIELA|nr:putative syntaxin 8 [Tieghemostelium lacteum]|eukprot:KYQ90677.1 putative syntaxin 8 [Tieghemostelium lacteum]